VTNQAEPSETPQLPSNSAPVIWQMAGHCPPPASPGTPGQMTGNAPGRPITETEAPDTIASFTQLEGRVEPVDMSAITWVCRTSNSHKYSAFGAGARLL